MISNNIKKQNEQNEQKKQLANRSGYTLIEVMVTIAIIAILTGLSLISLNTVFARKATRECTFLKTQLDEFVSNSTTREGDWSFIIEGVKEKGTSDKISWTSYQMVGNYNEATKLWVQSEYDKHVFKDVDLVVYDDGSEVTKKEEIKDGKSYDVIRVEMKVSREKGVFLPIMNNDLGKKVYEVKIVSKGSLSFLRIVKGTDNFYVTDSLA